MFKASLDPARLAVDHIALAVIQAPILEPRIMRYELTDYEWAAVRPFLPNKPRGVRNVQVLTVYSENRQNVAKVRAFVDGTTRRLD